MVTHRDEEEEDDGEKSPEEYLQTFVPAESGLFQSTS